MKPSSKTNIFEHITGEPGKIAALDGLRALAIFFVIFRHGLISFKLYFPEVYKNIQDTNFVTWMLNGWVGVDLFFVLSGFLIGYHLLLSWDKGSQSRIIFFGKYWLKRVLRTFPLYYAVIIIICFELIPLYGHTSRNMSADLGIHALFLQDYYGTNFLTPLWSLATEEKFYLVCPFIIWLIFKMLERNTFLALISTLVIFLPLALRLNSLDGTITSYIDFFWRLRAPFHLALDGLLIGLLTSFVFYYKPVNNFISKVGNTTFILTFISITILMIVNPWMSDNSQWTMTVILIFVFSILFGVLIYSSMYISGPLNALMGSKFLRFFSRVSYSLYLTHMLLIPLSYFLMSQLKVLFLPVYLVLSLYLGIYILLSLALSMLLHLVVERPFLKLKGRVSY